MCLINYCMMKSKGEDSVEVNMKSTDINLELLECQWVDNRLTLSPKVDKTIREIFKNEFFERNLTIPLDYFVENKNGNLELNILFYESVTFEEIDLISYVRDYIEDYLSTCEIETREENVILKHIDKLYSNLNGEFITTYTAQGNIDDEICYIFTDEKIAYSQEYIADETSFSYDYKTRKIILPYELKDFKFIEMSYNVKVEDKYIEKHVVVDNNKIKDIEQLKDILDKDKEDEIIEYGEFDENIIIQLKEYMLKCNEIEILLAWYDKDIYNITWYDVDWLARLFADTEEECIELYNKSLNDEIEDLQSLIDKYREMII